MTTTIETKPQDRREEAIQRLKARRDFFNHAIAFIFINALFVAVWYMTTPDGFFWPVFPIAGWGMGLFFHGVETFRRPPTEHEIQREMERLG